MLTGGYILPMYELIGRNRRPRLSYLKGAQTVVGQPLAGNGIHANRTTYTLSGSTGSALAWHTHGR